MRLRDLCLVGPFRTMEYMGEETVGEKKTKKPGIGHWRSTEKGKRHKKMKRNDSGSNPVSCKSGAATETRPIGDMEKTNVFSNPGSLTGSPQPYRKVDRSFWHSLLFSLLSFGSSWLKHATGGNRFWFPSIKALCFFCCLFPL